MLRPGTRISAARAVHRPRRSSTITAALPTILALACSGFQHRRSFIRARPAITNTFPRMSSSSNAAEGAALPSFSGRKLHQSALALLPDGDTPLYSSIQATRRVHDKHFKRWPPHVNILYPFVPEAEFEAAAQVLHHALSSFDPIEGGDCTMARVGFFEHGKSSCTAWLAPQTTEAAAAGITAGASGKDLRPTPHAGIVQLQSACQEALPDCNDLTASYGGRFTPHLSLGQFRTKEDVQKFIDSLDWAAEPFPVRYVYLLARDHGTDDPFSIRYIVPLGGVGEIIKVDPPPLSASLPPPPSAATKSIDSTTTSTTTAAPLSPPEMVVDGSLLEGGGQILRVSVALATLLRKSLRIHSIRAGRSKPGLQPQHLAGVKLAAEISQSQLRNGVIGSTDISLYPPPPSSSSSPPRHEFQADPGTAGSVTLLLQASLPLLAFSSSSTSDPASPPPIKLTLRGGTTVSHSPSIDYFVHVTAPLLARMGVHTHTKIVRRGYFPQGGGQVEVCVKPRQASPLEPLILSDPGQPTRILAFVAGIVKAGGAAQREIVEGLHANLATVVEEVFGQSLPVEFQDNVWIQEAPHVQQQGQGGGGGEGGGGGGGEGGRGRGSNKRARTRPKREVVHVLLVLETSTGCRLGADLLIEDLRRFNSAAGGGKEGGEKAEQRRVCRTLANTLHKYHTAGACVDEHTQDQLLIYLALAKGRSCVHGPPQSMITSEHLATAIHVTQQLLGVVFTSTVEEGKDSPVVIEVAEGLAFTRAGTGGVV